MKRGPSPGLKAWANTRADLPAVLANPDVLDHIILWRMNDPRYTDRANLMRNKAMQRQWTIEARADFSDKAKNDAITEAVRRAAVHINATLQLISDGVKPEVVAFSDDFFAGHEEIRLLPDTLGQAITDHGDLPETEVSMEMLNALRDDK